MRLMSLFEWNKMSAKNQRKFKRRNDVRIIGDNVPKDSDVVKRLKRNHGKIGVSDIGSLLTEAKTH